MNDATPTIVSMTEQLKAVLHEQQSCWLDGQQMLVEEILLLHPKLASSPDAVLKLVFNEAILRERTGCSVDVAEFQQRFPEIASELTIQWRADEALLSHRQYQNTLTQAPRQGPLLATSPTEVGRYRIECILGTGGMGVVYQAWDPALERKLALKMLKGSFHTEEAIARFRTEATAIAHIQHPHIAQVFDVGDCDGLPFFAMEYCAGGSLADQLKRGPLPASEAAAVLLQIGRGVMASHEHHILHRDLKPSNVLLTRAVELPPTLAEPSSVVESRPTNPAVPPSSKESPVYKITDFGLAKDLTNDVGQTVSGAILGTPNYMPPEQAIGQLKNLQPTADVYSLGAILYECLTGRPPFQGATIADTLNQVREQEPVPVRQLQPTVPRDLETICLTCLRKEQWRRYQTATAFVDDLMRFQEGKSILARPTGPVERGWRWAVRNKVVAALCAAVVLILGIAAVGGTVLSISLAAALGDAQRDRDRARTSDQQTREHLAASHAAAARLALQRGNGRAALLRLDEARNAGLDTAAMRLERVKALCTIHDLPAALEEIRTLVKRDDLGELAGEVLLWQADLELDAHTQDLEAGLLQIRQSLDRGLSVADQHYARGLLAMTVSEAKDHFRRAVQADPTNPRTNMMLTTLLVLSGQFPEARERLIAAQLLFPDHPGFILVHGMMDAFNERPDAVRQHLAVLKGQLAEQPYLMSRSIISYCSELTQFVRDLERVQCGDPTVSTFSVGIAFQRALMKMMSVQSNGGKDVFLPFPPGLVQAIQKVASKIPTGYTLLLPGNNKALGEICERLAEFHSDGFFWLFAGTQYAALKTIADWKHASQLLQRAVESDSFLPIRRMALFGVVVAESTLFRDDSEAMRAEHRAKALLHIARMAELGVIGEQGFKLAMHSERLNVPPELAWRVMAAWERAAPQDSRLPLYRAKFHRLSGAYESAIKLADEALKKKEDPEWRALRTEAVEEWKRQSEAFLPTVVPMSAK